jgi:hypothetical protein
MQGGKKGGNAMGWAGVFTCRDLEIYSISMSDQILPRNHRSRVGTGVECRREYECDFIDSLRAVAVENSSRLVSVLKFLKRKS